MFHILEYLATRTEEHIGIAVLVVKLGDGTIEAALARKGEGEAMNESLAFLAVALGGKGIDTVGDILEEGFEFSPVCHKFLFCPDVRTVKRQVVFLICVKQIRENLLTHNLIWDDEFCVAHVCISYSHQSEIVEQTYEVVVIGNILCRKSFLQFPGHVAFRHQCLDDGGIVGKLLVLADEHTQLLIVNADVLIEHPLGQSTPVAYIFIKERENHVGVVHRCLSVCVFRETVVIVIRLHNLDEFIDGVVELVILTILSKHLAHLFFGEAHHLVEVIVE